jgi:signal transduction histidine kinase
MLSIVSVEYFLFIYGYTETFFPLSLHHLLSMGAFFMTALIVLCLAGSLRRAQTQAQARAVENAELYTIALAASRAKSDFLATMSHELRTPLTAIIGYEELLAEEITGPINQEQRAQLGRIKVSANHLLGLIDEVLTFSRLEAGRESVHIEHVPVQRILDDTMTITMPLAQAKGLSLTVQPVSASLRIETDVQKLRQILVNLLSNAIKFTEQGHISLEVVDDDRTLAFIVRDSGIGIVPEMIDQIWEPFTQADPVSTRRTSGTGLGLSVSQRLAHLLSGAIDVQSEVGTGSVFTLRLPHRYIPDITA